MSDEDAFWERRAATLGHDDEVLHGTVTTEAAVVRLRDRLEKAHLARVVPLAKDARVLDLGGGAGRLALWLAPRVREVTLVEPSAAQLAVAVRLARARGLDNVRCVRSTIEGFALDEGAWDLIVIGGVLTHLDDAAVQALVAPLGRALAPGGRLVLKEPVSTDGALREDRREGYVARFRPREAYAAIFGATLPLLYQRATLAHPIPFFLGGTNEAAARTEGRLGPLIDRVAPLWERLDPALQRVELALRASPLRRVLADVPVLQDLYVFAAPPREGAGEAPALSVVVIAYDEEECVEAVVGELAQALTGQCAFELVLVDDGSKDATRALMEHIAARDARVRVVPLWPNRGIGGALRAGFDAARGAHVTWVPADGQIGPDTVRALFARRHEAPMLTTVYASRDDALYRHVISKTLNAFIRVRSGEVAKSGGNYIFDRTMWERHAPRGDDSMMISTVFRKNLRDAGVPILEVPIHARARVAGRSKVLNARTIWRTLASAAKIGR